MSETNTNRRNLQIDLDEEHPEIVEEAQRFLEQLETLIQSGESEISEDEFRERAGSLARAIIDADDELATDLGNVDVYSSRVTGEASEQLEQLLRTGTLAAVNRSWLLQVLEGYEVAGTNFGVDHDAVYDLLIQFIEVEVELPEAREEGYEGIEETDQKLSNPKSPFVESSELTSSLEAHQEQVQAELPTDDELMLDVLEEPPGLIPVSAVYVLPISLRLRSEQTSNVETTVSVDMDEPLFGGFVDIQPESSEPVDPELENELRSAVAERNNDASSENQNIGVGDTSAEKTVELTREQTVIGLAVYIDDITVEEVMISAEPDTESVAETETTVLFQSETEGFIEARAEALDTSVSWMTAVAGGGAVAGGTMVGGYLLYNKFIN